MSKNKISFKMRFRYHFDNFMSRGGFALFLALMCLFVGAIVAVSLLRWTVNVVAPQDSFANVADQWWLTFLQIADGGAIGEDTANPALHRAVGVIGLFLGMVLFSSLVAFITSQFERVLADLKKGRSQVIEKGHTLVIGFNDRAIEIIRELITANESEKDAAIVVISEQEKDVMDDFFRERIANFGPTRLVTRSGPTSGIHILKKASVSRARSVIILNDVRRDASNGEKLLGDSRVLKTILAVISCTGEGNEPPIVADLHMSGKMRLARNLSPRVTTIDDNMILSKLMVQTSRVSGLAQVYDHIVGFDGNEFYFHRPATGFEKQALGRIQFHYPTCSVMGIRGADGTLALNPSSDRVLQDDEEVLVLAEDDSAIVYSDKPLLPDSRRIFTPMPNSPQLSERQLIVGWSQKTPLIISEYAQYLKPGSGIDILVDSPNDEILESFETLLKQHATIELNLMKGRVDDPALMTLLKPEKYANAIILARDDADAEVIDADTIAILLEFRQYFKELNIGEVETQLITEVANSDNVDIIMQAGVKDFLISNRFVSKVYAQVSQNADVLKVYEDLFSEAGSELYLKPLRLFLETPSDDFLFADLCGAAQARGEICLGVRKLSEEFDADCHYGIHINPAKSDRFALTLDDCLITLAENEG